MKNAGFFVLLAFMLASQAAFAQQNRYGYNQYGQYVGQPINPYAMPGQAGTINPYPGPGQSSRSGGYYYGQYPYANQPGYGYYTANPYAPVYPALGAPVPINGGMFRFNVGGFSGAYWKSPSGYYYPWGAGAIYATPPPIIVVQQGASQATQPPVTDMLKDMNTYIEEQNTKKKFKPDDYQHLSRRLRDIQNLESSMRARNGGILDPGDEETIRKNMAMLAGDISRRVIP